MSSSKLPIVPKTNITHPAQNSQQSSHLFRVEFRFHHSSETCHVHEVSGIDLEWLDVQICIAKTFRCSWLVVGQKMSTLTIMIIYIYILLIYDSDFLNPLGCHFWQIFFFMIYLWFEYDFHLWFFMGSNCGYEFFMVWICFFVMVLDVIFLWFFLCFF